jgi:DNA-directed RNA polymerase subunit F
MATSIKTGLQNEAKVKDILISGSGVINTRNEFGVHTFSDQSPTDGILASKLIKPLYNIPEIVKSLDVTITELIPSEVTTGPATVLKTVYDVALNEIQLRDATISSLNKNILTLNSKIGQLESVTQSLLIDLDNQRLLVANADNQNAITTTRIRSGIVDLQNAIQKGTSEAIQRVSYLARIKALEKENATLKEELFGKQAKVAEGFKVSEDFAYKILEITDKDYDGLRFDARANEASEKWANGPSIQIDNFSAVDITVTFSEIGDDLILEIPPVTLKAGANAVVKIKENISSIRGKRPFGPVGTSGDKDYFSTINMKSSGGPVVPIKMKLHKWRKYL